MHHITANLYISDRFAAGDSELIDRHSIGHVITLDIERHQNTSVHHPLVDGQNPQSQFDHAVDLVREQYGKEGNVLVHCAVGISRSVAVVATAIAAEEGVSFNEGLEIVKGKRSNANPKPELRSHADSYLNTQRS